MTYPCILFSTYFSHFKYKSDVAETDFIYLQALEVLGPSVPMDMYLILLGQKGRQEICCWFLEDKDQDISSTI